MRSALSFAFLLAFAGVTEAQTRVNPPAQTKARPAPVRQTRSPATDPSLVSPTLQRTAPARYDIGGGSSCRTACSQTYYFCSADGEWGCSSRWSQCLAACPKASGEP
jgi:hypothetical protein